MAIMKGPFHLQGKIGDLRYYYNSAAKKWCVSGNGGANREIIAKNPNMVHNREINNEFKAVTKWGSLLRKALLDIDHLNKGYYMSLMVRAAKAIQKMDIPGVMGQRNIFSSRFKWMLPDIIFNEDHPFRQVFSHRLLINADPSRKEITLSIQNLVSWFEISWPQPFEWYRITLVIAQQPDYLWNPAFKIYNPAYPLLHDRSISVRSEWLKRSQRSVDIVLAASFRDTELPPDDVSVVVAMGVELASSMVGDSYAVSPGNGTMAIVACL